MTYPLRQYLKVLVMLIESFTMIAGLSALMLVLVAVVCAAWDSLAEMGRSARAQMKPARKAHSYEAPGALATLEYALDRASGSHSAQTQ